MSRRYKFVSSFEKEEEVPVVTTSFYQVAAFPHPSKNKHQIRRFVLNDHNEFVDVRSVYLSEDQFKKFITTRSPNVFKCFSVYTLDDIDYPTLPDVLTAKSSIMSQDLSYDNYARF